MPLKIVESFGVKLLRTHHSLVFLSGFVLHLYLNLYFMRQCNIYLSVCGAFCRQGRAGTGVMVAVIHALHYTHHYHTALRPPHCSVLHNTTLPVAVAACHTAVKLFKHCCTTPPSKIYIAPCSSHNITLHPQLHCLNAVKCTQYHTAHTITHCCKHNIKLLHYNPVK